MRDGQETRRILTVCQEQRAENVQKETDRDNRDETREMSRSLVEFIALILRASETLTLSTPGFQLATLAISRDRILPILVSFVSSFFPSLPYLARRRADLGIASAMLEYFAFEYPDYVEHCRY